MSEYARGYGIRARDPLSLIYGAKRGLRDGSKRPSREKVN